MRRLSASLVLLLSTMLALAPGGDAAVPVLRLPVTGPGQQTVPVALFGGGVVVSTSTRTRAVVRRVIPGGAAVQLDSEWLANGGGENSGSDSFSALASPGHLVTRDMGQRPGYKGSGDGFDTYRAGPLAGPLAPVSPCAMPPPGSPGSDYGIITSGRAALGDDALVVSCPSNTYGAVVTVDLRTGARRTLPTATTPAYPGALVEAAGRYVATLDGGSVLVWDADAGAVAYRVAVPVLSPAGFTGLSLQADGRVLIAQGPSDSYECSTTLLTATPAAPMAVRLPGTACGTPTLAGDRVLETTGAPSVTGVQWVGLDGGVHPVARFPAGRLSGRPVTDGTQVAISEPACASDAVFLLPLSGPVVTLPDLRCGAQVVSGSLRVSRDGRLQVRVRCPSGCEGSVRLTARLGGSYRALLTSKSLVVSRGSASVQLRVPPTRRRPLRQACAKRAPIEVHVEVNPRFNPSFHDPSHHTTNRLLRCSA